MTWYRAVVLFGLAVVAAVATWNAVHARLIVDGMMRLESGRVEVQEPIDLAPVELQVAPQKVMEVPPGRKLVKSWECEDGTITITTCCGISYEGQPIEETREECLARHRAEVEWWMEQCPPDDD